MNRNEIITNAFTNWDFLKSINYNLVSTQNIKDQGSDLKNNLQFLFENEIISRQISFGIFENGDGGVMENVFLVNIRCLTCTNVRYTNFSFEKYFTKNNRSADLKKFCLHYYSKTITTESICLFLKFIESIFQEKEIQDMLCNDTWLDNYFFEFR